MRSNEFKICLFDQSCPDFLKVLANGKELEIIYHLVSQLEVKFTSEELNESVRVLDRMEYLCELTHPTLIEFCETQAIAIATGKAKGWFDVETPATTQRAKPQGFQRRLP